MYFVSSHIKQDCSTALQHLQPLLHVCPPRSRSLLLRHCRNRAQTARDSGTQKPPHNTWETPFLHLDLTLRSKWPFQVFFHCWWNTTPVPLNTTPETDTSFKALISEIETGVLVQTASPCWHSLYGIHSGSLPHRGLTAVQRGLWFLLLCLKKKRMHSIFFNDNSWNILVFFSFL